MYYYVRANRAKYLLETCVHSLALMHEHRSELPALGELLPGLTCLSVLSV